MRVLGVDPGTICTGVGLVMQEGAKQQAGFIGTIRVRRDVSLPERLYEIYRHLKAVVEKTKPDVVAVETAFFHGLKDARSAVKIGEARALALVAAAERGLEVVEYPPARIKQAICGNGAARKEQMQYMVSRLLKLDKEPQQDAADALAVALCHLYALKFRTGVLASINREAKKSSVHV